MRKLSIFIAILLFVFATSSLSQEPCPPVAKGKTQPREINSKINSQGNIKTDNNQKDSIKPISTINQINTAGENSGSQSGQKTSNDGKQGTANNDPIAIYTKWIMVFTGILAIGTICLWWSTRKSAEAAKKAAEALPKIERAYLFVDLSGPVATIKDYSKGEPPTHTFTNIPIKLFNAGKTPAVLTKIYANIEVTGVKPTKDRAEKVIKEIPFSDMRGDDSNKREIGSGKLWKVTFRLGNIADTDFLKAIVNMDSNPLQIFCYGKVTYKDIMKNNRNTWFCWQLHSTFLRQSFFRSDNEELNDYT